MQHIRGTLQCTVAKAPAYYTAVINAAAPHTQSPQLLVSFTSYTLSDEPDLTGPVLPEPDLTGPDIALTSKYVFVAI